jgi:hypothetical protein
MPGTLIAQTRVIPWCPSARASSAPRIPETLVARGDLANRTGRAGDPACYHLVPGVVRFYDTNSLPALVEDQGLTVVQCNGEPGRVTVLARA